LTCPTEIGGVGVGVGLFRQMGIGGWRGKKGEVPSGLGVGGASKARARWGELEWGRRTHRGFYKAAVQRREKRVIKENYRGGPKRRKKRYERKEKYTKGGGRGLIVTLAGGKKGSVEKNNPKTPGASRRQSGGKRVGKDGRGPLTGDYKEGMIRCCLDPRGKNLGGQKEVKKKLSGMEG